MTAAGAQERGSEEARAPITAGSRWWVVALALALAWLAVNLVLGMVVAPGAFALTKQDVLTRDQAGLLFGVVLERWSEVVGFLVVGLCVGLGSLCGRWFRARRSLAASGLLVLLTLTVGLHVTSHRTVRDGNVLNAQRMQVKHSGSVDGELEQRFAALHQRSYALFLGETLAVALIAALAIAALVRRPAASAPATAT